MRREREREKKERGAYHGGPSPIKRILLFELNSIRVDRLIVRSRSRTCGRVVTSADPWPRRSRIIIGGTPRVGTRADRKSPSVRHECSPHVRRTIGQKGLIRPRRFHPTFPKYILSSNFVAKSPCFPSLTVYSPFLRIDTLP